MEDQVVDTPEAEPTEDADTIVEDLKAKLTELESKNIEQAQQEIQAICEKYGVKLEALAVIPATQVRIVPQR